MHVLNLFIPVNLNDGSPVDQSYLNDIKNQLAFKFGGCTIIKSTGAYKFSDADFFQSFLIGRENIKTEPILIYIIYIKKNRKNLKFIKELCIKIKNDLKQESVLYSLQKIKTFFI